jgi:hypothetical protein
MTGGKLAPYTISVKETNSPIRSSDRRQKIMAAIRVKTNVKPIKKERL